MARFNYKAKKGLNQTLEGIIEAGSQDEALARLTEQGLFPIVIEESLLKGKAHSKPTAKKLNKKISSSEIFNFTQKLVTLTRAKVELLTSLKILYEQAENVRFQGVILEVYNSTKEGKALSESLSRFPLIFSSLFINIVKAGEASGRLDEALSQISDFLSRAETLRNKVRLALAYPLLLLAVGIASIFILMNFVIPKLKPIFSGLGKDLPLITRVILQTSEFSSKTLWIALPVFFLALWLLYQQKGNLFFRNLFKIIKMRLPILKRLTKNQELAHFSRSLGLLLESGVPALQSLDIATLAIDDPKLKKGLRTACQDVASGESISKCLESSTNLPVFFVRMVAVGEESGRLSEVLREISSSYTQAAESDISLISSILEPVLILILGIVLGTIVLSMLLPIFQVTQLVH